jgi:hypothetical protein
VGDDLRAAALAAVLGGPAPKLDATFDVDETTLAHVLADDLGRATPHDDIVERGLGAVVDGDAQSGDGASALGVAELRVAGQATDEGGTVERRSPARAGSGAALGCGCCCGFPAGHVGMTSCEWFDTERQAGGSQAVHPVGRRVGRYGGRPKGLTGKGRPLSYRERNALRWSRRVRRMTHRPLLDLNSALLRAGGLHRPPCGVSRGSATGRGRTRRVAVPIAAPCALTPGAAFSGITQASNAFDVVEAHRRVGRDCQPAVTVHEPGSVQTVQCVDHVQLVLLLDVEHTANVLLRHRQHVPRLQEDVEEFAFHAPIRCEHWIVVVFLRDFLAANRCYGRAHEPAPAMDEPDLVQPLYGLVDIAWCADRPCDLVFGPRALVVRRDEKPEDRPLKPGELLGLPWVSLRVRLRHDVARFE